MRFSEPISRGSLFDARLPHCIVKVRHGAQQPAPAVGTDMKTGKVEVLAAGFEGKQFNGPNDVTIDAKGRLYFTDRSRFRVSGSRETEECAPACRRYIVWTRTGRSSAPRTPDTESPNGLVISPDDKTFYLIEAHKTEGGARAIRCLHPAGGWTGAPKMRVHYNFYPGRSADGGPSIAQGNLYAAAGLHRRRGRA